MTAIRWPQPGDYARESTSAWVRRAQGRPPQPTKEEQAAADRRVRKAQLEREFWRLDDLRRAEEKRLRELPAEQERQIAAFHASRRDPVDNAIRQAAAQLELERQERQRAREAALVRREQQEQVIRRSAQAGGRCEECVRAGCTEAEEARMHGGYSGPVSRGSRGYGEIWR